MNVERASAAARVYPGVEGPAAAEAAGGIPRRDGVPLTEASARLLASASPTTKIQALQILARDLQKDVNEGAILGKKTEVEEARRQIQEALDRAHQEAGEKAGWDRWTGTLSTIAKVAAVAAAVASVALTGGVSAPLLIGLAGTLISATAKPLCDATGAGDKAEKALTYGGAALSLVGGGAGAFSSAGAASGATATAASTTVRLGTAAGGAATAASGYTGYQAGVHGARETLARADETGLRAQKKQMLQQLDQLIALLQEVDQSFSRAIGTAQKARDSEAASALALTAGVRA